MVATLPFSLAFGPRWTAHAVERALERKVCIPLASLVAQGFNRGGRAVPGVVVQTTTQSALPLRAGAELVVAHTKRHELVFTAYVRDAEGAARLRAERETARAAWEAAHPGWVSKYRRVPTAALGEEEQPLGGKRWARRRIKAARKAAREAGVDRRDP